jgi:hypothetical protein
VNASREVNSLPPDAAAGAASTPDRLAAGVVALRDAAAGDVRRNA